MSGWCALALALALTGCKSGITAKPAPPPPPPQQQINPQTGQPIQATTVLVRGNVTNPIVNWTENMTLAEAIVAAGYRDTFSPHMILLIRNGQMFRIDPNRLLSGAVNPVLEPGDAIDLQQ